MYKGILLFIFSLFALSIYLYKPVKVETLQIQAEPLNINYEKMMALSYLNDLRIHSGMSPYKKNDILEKSASAHAKYLITHNISEHYELLNKEYFSGETPTERALSVNYQYPSVSENITSNTRNYKDSIDGLFAAIYHRFSFLDFKSNEIGIGVLQDTIQTHKNAFVYNMGVFELNQLCSAKSYKGTKTSAYNICVNKDLHIEKRTYLRALNQEKKASKKIIVFPYKNQIDVPPVFYNETPDPLPQHGVSGFPISIQFNDYYYDKVKLLSMRLFHEDNSEVFDTLLMSKSNDPNAKFTSLQFALFPLTRLQYNSRYKVVVTYKIKRKLLTKEWYFNTKNLEQPFSIVEDNEVSIVVEQNIKHTIYFKPTDNYDTIKNLKFPLDVIVDFLDNNTIEITLTTDNDESFEVKSDKKTIYVDVK